MGNPRRKEAPSNSEGPLLTLEFVPDSQSSSIILTWALEGGWPLRNYEPPLQRRKLRLKAGDLPVTSPGGTLYVLVQLLNIVIHGELSPMEGDEV